MTSMSMNERLLHLERQYMELDQCRAEAGKPAPSLSEAIEAVIGTMADMKGGGTAGTGARLRVLERELVQAVPAPSCARLASAARADLDAGPPDGDADADADVMAAGRRFALHHQLAAGAEDDCEADRHLDAYDRIGREMTRIPARTVAGVALKLFVDLILEHGCQPGRPFGIHKPDGAPYGDPLAWSAITDLHRLTRHLLPEEFRLDEGAPQGATDAETDGKGRRQAPRTPHSAIDLDHGSAMIRPLRVPGPGDERSDGRTHTSWAGTRPVPPTFRTTD